MKRKSRKRPVWLRPDVTIGYGEAMCWGARLFVWGLGRRLGVYPVWQRGRPIDRAEHWGVHYDAVGRYGYRARRPVVLAHALAIRPETLIALAHGFGMGGFS